MHIHFKSKVILGKKSFGPGNVDVDVASLAPHEQKYVHALIQSKHATAADRLPIDPTPEEDKSKELAERFLAEAGNKKPRGPIKDVNSLPDDVQAADPSDEESSDDSEEDAEEGEESNSEAEEPSKERSHHAKKKKGRR